MSKFFAPVPLDFTQAFRAGQLRPGAYLVGCYLADESFRTVNTDGGLVTLHIASLAELCEVHPVTIRRALRALEQAGWIACDEVEERQRGPWRIRLTGLARERDSDSTATRGLRHESQSLSGPVAVDVAELSAQQAEVQPPLEAVDVAVREDTDETRRDEKGLKANPCIEEKLDHVVGKTTADDEPPYESEPEFPQLLDLEQANPYHENDRLLSDEEISELGAVPLGELHRRHERGEL